jgi:hypothetical protein
VTMTALFFIGLGWWTLALLLGLFIGLSIRIADKAESPEQPADADTARLDVWA